MEASVANKFSSVCTGQAVCSIDGIPGKFGCLKDSDGPSATIPLGAYHCIISIIQFVEAFAANFITSIFTGQAVCRINGFSGKLSRLKYRDSPTPIAPNAAYYCIIAIIQFVDATNANTIAWVFTCQAVCFIYRFSRKLRSLEDCDGPSAVVPVVSYHRIIVTIQIVEPTIGKTLAPTFTCQTVCSINGFSGKFDCFQDSDGTFSAAPIGADHCIMATIKSLDATNANIIAWVFTCQTVCFINGFSGKFGCFKDSDCTFSTVPVGTYHCIIAIIQFVDATIANIIASILTGQTVCFIDGFSGKICSFEDCYGPFVFVPVGRRHGIMAIIHFVDTSVANFVVGILADQTVCRRNITTCGHAWINKCYCTLIGPPGIALEYQCLIVDDMYFSIANLIPILRPCPGRNQFSADTFK